MRGASLGAVVGAAFICAAGCQTAEPVGRDMVGATTVAMTPAEEDAVVDLVNEASLALLDDDVGLDKRAAENIIAHRAGLDAIDDTNDDNPFDDIDELDAVPYVGPAALAKLVAYAHAQGYVDADPTGDDALILGVANSASLSVLDHDVGLDKRAAENIVAHRVGSDAVAGTADDDPFDDIDELDAIPYVGPAALAALLAFAKAETPSAGDCLIISEYIEGQGNNNKAIELFNCGANPLALGDYGVCLVRNEATTCTVTAKLVTSTLAPGAVRTVCRTTPGTFNDPMQFIADRCEIELPGVMTFNGDDRIAIFKDVDGDGAYGGADTIADMLGRFGYQPPITTWQDLTLRRCNFTPTDGQAYFDHADYFITQAWGDQQDFGVAPTETCGAATLGPASFAEDLKAALVAHYAQYGTDIAMMGGNTLAAAQSAVTQGSVQEIVDPDENPLGFDLSAHRVFAHPDVVFPGSDMVWFGVYTNAGSLVAIEPFN
jgi:DNA uptake protein ComE-like DNA-binding protein